jgi:hypothetical protein
MKTTKVKVWKALMVSDETHKEVVVTAKKCGLTVDEFMKGIFRELYGERNKNNKRKNKSSIRESK